MRFPFFDRRDRGMSGPYPGDVPADMARDPAAHRRRSVTDAECAALAEEVEAWANGELADLRSRGRLPLSSWLVVNRLAHADPAVLVGMAAGDEPEDGSPLRRIPTWAAAERGLARYVAGDGISPDDIVALQRGTLVPLELRLIEQSEAGPLTLGQVVAAFFKVLGRPRLEG